MRVNFLRLSYIRRQQLQSKATTLILLISAFLAILAFPVRMKASEVSWQSVIDIALERINHKKNKNNPKKISESKIPNEASQKNKAKNLPSDDINLSEVEKHAEFASDVTGVNKDYLMGMLVVESALGQNTGQCTYKEVEEGALNAHANGRLSERAWETFKKRQETIMNLSEELNYDHEKLKVSCNPPYAGTGGAMGVGQFMPDTWLEYRDRIAIIVGKENPDPWDVRDGTVAMALKLSDVPGVKEHNVWSERNASKYYLSGTTSVAYEWYANEAQYWKNNYQKLLT